MLPWSRIGPWKAFIPSIVTSFVGTHLPTPFVDDFPFGKLDALKSAFFKSLCVPKATSHNASNPSLFDMFEQQYPADFVTISAKYTPFPNMYPVAGASGGAILSP